MTVKVENEVVRLQFGTDVVVVEGEDVVGSVVLLLRGDRCCEAGDCEEEEDFHEKRLHDCDLWVGAPKIRFGCEIQGFEFADSGICLSDCCEFRNADEKDRKDRNRKKEEFI